MSGPTHSMAPQPDLTPFVEINARAGKKMSWEQRVEMIGRFFPNAIGLDWKAAFDKDLDLFAWIMRDVLKADAAEPGRSGPKPGVEYSSGVKRFRALMGDDYSMLIFSEAFTILAGNRSLSGLAAKTGLSRSQVRRLLRGEIEPSAMDMEAVARGFHKQPGYFLEYRRGFVLAAICERLTQVPEASVRSYEALRQAAMGRAA